MNSPTPLAPWPHIADDGHYFPATEEYHCNLATVAFYEQRLRVAVGWLREHADGKRHTMKAHEALALIGELPPEETKHE